MTLLHRACIVCSHHASHHRFNKLETDGNPSNGVCDECKLYARQGVALAFSRGQISCSKICQDCGCQTDTQPHHASYQPDQYLAVTWLCLDCHRTRHNLPDQAIAQDDLPIWLQPWTQGFDRPRKGSA